MFGSPFSLNPLSAALLMNTEIYDAEFFTESADAVIGLGSLDFDMAVYREDVAGALRGAAAIWEDVGLLETVGASVNLLVVVADTSIFTETASARIALGSNPLAVAEFAERATAALAIGSDLCLTLDFAGSVETVASLGAQAADSIVMTGFVHMLARAGATTQEVILLSVLIPPGASLRLDSGDYTALLESAGAGACNILHLYDGPWLFMDRTVTGIIVNASTGAEMDATLEYTERWL